MNKKLKTIIMVAVLAIAFYGIYSTGLIDTLKDFDEFQKLIEDAGSLGYVIYILIFIAAAVFSLPASVITISGGIVFGPVLGAILALAGATAGAIAAFLVSRYIARDFIVDKFGKNAIFKKIESGVEKNGKDFLILTRLVPVFPYNIQNYAYGVTNIELATYSIITLITMAPGAFVYAYMAGEIAQNGITTGFFVKLLLAGVVLFGVSQIPKIFAKKKGIDMDPVNNK
ncbi:TVP38/TMEM64 family protein [Alkaliphilus pronyensis]|uniref:TVP38/TMEM64 family protein n=1 Tax=Alkaliphilus pronyensis TaxID=1482732 RepID=A0A6I0F5M7_9FIRM|nr:TVP38/TMEM64 family protein [Alkaliphilus pronyensis]KAB3535319.1 TVP38/TMEM64 family protein [Alkaliphilus pronyensis]